MSKLGKSMKSSLAYQRRIADIKKGKVAFKDIITSSSTILDLVDKYGSEIFGSLGGDQIEAAKALVPRLFKLHLESLEGISIALAGSSTVLEKLSQPTAPSKKPCSFYGTGGRGCVYCGLPKSKHSKHAQNKQRVYKKGNKRPDNLGGALL